jgi:protein gp37
MSKIEWCDITINPVWGCKFNCDYCYARGIARRFALQTAKKECDHIGAPYSDKLSQRLANFQPTLLKSHLDKKLVKKPKRIFINSMSDPYFWEESWIKAVIAKIEEYPQHTFLMLTKAPEAYFKFPYIPDNLWVGVTATNQSEYNKRVTRLVAVRAKVRFVSFEPLLGHVSLGLNLFHPDDKIHWIIAGGMTGIDSKLMRMKWIQTIRNHCEAMNVPFFFKGYGDWCRFDQLPDNLKNWVKKDPKRFNSIDADDRPDQLYYNISKKWLDRTFYGKEYNQIPEL